MIFKSKVGISFSVVFVLWCVSTIVLAYFAIDLKVTSLFIITAIWLTVLILFFVRTMIIIKTKTFFEIADSDLIITSGRHEIKIPYTKIVSVSQGVKSLQMEAFTTSFLRVEVKYENQNGISDRVHIAPHSENEFVKLLRSKI